MNAKKTAAKRQTLERYHNRGRRILQQWQLHLLILLPLAYIIIFHYGPIYGAQIAFRQYSPRKGITGSDWVGLKWFKKFLSSYNFRQILRNTIVLSMYQILAGFPVPVIFALFLNACRSDRLKRTVQTITYMPHFISMVVIVSIVNMVFSPIIGVYSYVYHWLGGKGYPEDIRGLQETFRHFYVWSGIWQNLGWDTIIYTAALASVSPDLHEAAMLDGASRLKRIFHVDLPTILPTIGIMLIMRCGHVMSIGFEKVYLMQSTLNLPTSEVISTHVYKVGMGNTSDMSYAAAVGLFNSVVNCLMLIFVNWLSKRISHKEVSLY